MYEESAKFRGLSWFLGGVDQIVAWVAWITWVSKILAWVNKILAWVDVNQKFSMGPKLGASLNLYVDQNVQART